MLCIGLTPAWLLPNWLALPWLLVGLILGVPALFYSWRYAPWVPTPDSEFARIIEHLALESHQSFCDLGAGDGRMLVRVHAATGANCIGIEVSPAQYLLARLRLAISGKPGTAVVFKDLYKADLSGFDALYVWGTEYWVGTPEFAEHMERALTPGTRLISYHYRIREREPDHIDWGGLRPIYVYVF